MGPLALLPIRKERELRIFIALKIIALAGLEPATFGSSGKHTNHYTTKATAASVTAWFVCVKQNNLTFFVPIRVRQNDTDTSWPLQFCAILLLFSISLLACLEVGTKNTASRAQWIAVRKQVLKDATTHKDTREHRIFLLLRIRKKSRIKWNCPRYTPWRHLEQRKYWLWVSVSGWYRSKRLFVTIFWSIVGTHLISYSSWFIHQSSLESTNIHLVANQQKRGGEFCRWNISLKFRTVL
jgi:hypothetical protein